MLTPVTVAFKSAISAGRHTDNIKGHPLNKHRVKRPLFNTRIAKLTSVLAILWHASVAAEHSDTSVPTVNIHVAVAANFRNTLNELIKQFNQTQAPERPFNVIVSSSASGSLYQQILHGAPYDIFLSADSRYPQRLAETLALPAPRTYAMGKLLLWHPQYAHLAIEDLTQLTLAIANPKTAPYGRAGKQVLARLNRHKNGQLVTGNNVAQVFQFTHSGNVDVGFIAASQLQQFPDPLTKTRFFDVPQTWYDPIKQQGLQLRNFDKHSHTTTFFEFLFSDHSQQWIAANGYQSNHNGVTLPAVQAQLNGQTPINQP